MLNLFKEKKNFFVLPTKDEVISKENETIKHYPSPIREWNNSIYVFNKNNLKLIPNTALISNNFIKNYFNLYNRRLEHKIRTKKLSLRLRKLSSNKIFISNGGFKHTNNKVLINLYVFNRQKDNFLLTLKKWYLNTFLVDLQNKTTFLSKNSNDNININLINRIKNINNKSVQDVRKNRSLLIKVLNTITEKKSYKFKTVANYTKTFYSKLIKKSLKKIRMYFFYKQLLHINKSKLNYTYLQYLSKFLEKIYKKNVEFNIINLRKFYLNSDILSQSITNKITKNRRKLSRQLTNLNNKIKIQNKKVLLSRDQLKFNILTDSSEQTTNLSQDKSLLQKHIISNLKYKDITGYRLEIKGRITKRHAAARAGFKFKHKGGILDIDSSYRGLSSVLLKGNLKSNTQYTNLKSKTRIGSFGIKGWVSGN